MIRMRRPRVIPVLLLSGDGLVKTQKFDDPKYIGDPINAVKIFNDSEVDELILLDITSGRQNQPPQYERLKEILSEAFMPVCYGGAVRTFEQVEKLFAIGVEKVSFNTACGENPKVLSETAKAYGNQSVVASIDVKKTLFGRYDVILGGKKSAKALPVEWAKKMVDLGAGEILINSVDRDGMRDGYDLELIQQVAQSVDVPVIACGGAHELKDFHRAIFGAGASAVAAGSMFVFHGKLRGVLIHYPTQRELRELFQSTV